MGVSLAINNAVGPDRRGELNGISASVGALGKAFSPMFFSALFALSIDGDRPFPFDYHLVFYLLGLLRLTVACMGWNIIDGAGREENLDAETSTTGESKLDEYIETGAETSTGGESTSDEYIGTDGKASTAGESTLDAYTGTKQRGGDSAVFGRSDEDGIRVGGRGDGVQFQREVSLE